MPGCSYPTPRSRMKPQPSRYPSSICGTGWCAALGPVKPGLLYSASLLYSVSSPLRSASPAIKASCPMPWATSAASPWMPTVTGFVRLTQWQHAQSSHGSTLNPGMLNWAGLLPRVACSMIRVRTSGMRCSDGVVLPGAPSHLGQQAQCQLPISILLAGAIASDAVMVSCCHVLSATSPSRPSATCHSSSFRQSPSPAMQ